MPWASGIISLSLLPPSNISPSASVPPVLSLIRWRRFALFLPTSAARPLVSIHLCFLFSILLTPNYWSSNLKTWALGRPFLTNGAKPWLRLFCFLFIYCKCSIRIWAIVCLWKIQLPPCGFGDGRGDPLVFLSLYSNGIIFWIGSLRLFLRTRGHCWFLFGWNLIQQRVQLVLKCFGLKQELCSSNWTHSHGWWDEI